MKPRKRKSKGVLLSLGMIPKSTPKKKHRQPLWRRILKWIGGTIMALVLLVIMIGTGAKFFRSNLGIRLITVKAEVEQVLQDPELLPPGGVAVAVAKVTLVGDDDVYIPLDAEQFAQVRVGTMLVVEFEYKGIEKEARVLDWGIKDLPEEEDPEPVTNP